MSSYLGLPNLLGRNKIAIFGYFKDKLKQRVLQWEAWFSSRAGKEVLLKTVAQSLPTYAMGVFLLPISLCHDLEGIMSSFWWKTSKGLKRRVHWKRWGALSRHKVLGGLGFRDLHDFNLALLSKQSWRLLTRPHSLVSQIFKARYFPHGSFLDAKVGSNPSFIWSSLWATQDLIRAGARIRVGNGLRTNIVDDPWLNCPSNPFITSVHPGLIGRKVVDIMHTNSMAWDTDIVSDMFNERDADMIFNIPLSSVSCEDSWYSGYEKSGCFSVKSLYRHIQAEKHKEVQQTSEFIWKVLWSLQVPPKFKSTFWRAASGCLPTREQLRSHVPLSPWCPICHTHR